MIITYPDLDPDPDSQKKGILIRIQLILIRNTGFGPIIWLQQIQSRSTEYVLLRKTFLGNLYLRVFCNKTLTNIFFTSVVGLSSLTQVY